MDGLRAKMHDTYPLSETPPIPASKVQSHWLKDAVARLKGLASSKELGDRARVTENVLLGQYDRETTIALAKTVVDFDDAFKGKKGAIVIDLGLFIFVRESSWDGDGAIYAKRLTVEERALLDSPFRDTCASAQQQQQLQQHQKRSSSKRRLSNKR